MRIEKSSLENFKKQIDLDFNVKEAKEIKKNFYLSPSKILEGSRKIDKMDPFFRALVIMGQAYIMADEEMLSGWEEILKDKDPEWLFEYPTLRTIDHILHEFGREIVDTHIYFLPGENTICEKEWGNEVWFNKTEIEQFREKNEFHNAYFFSENQPDEIGVAIKENGKYVAMAGASKDGKYVRQIGIDVKEGYEGKGYGTHLVALLKDRIIKEGFTPFYGTCESHSISRNVAINAGFMPAFSEFLVAKAQDKKI